MGEGKSKNGDMGATESIWGLSITLEVYGNEKKHGPIVFRRFFHYRRREKKKDKMVVNPFPIAKFRVANIFF